MPSPTKDHVHQNLLIQKKKKKKKKKKKIFKYNPLKSMSLGEDQKKENV